MSRATKCEVRTSSIDAPPDDEPCTCVLMTEEAFTEASGAPRVRLSYRFSIAPEASEVSRWVEAENAAGHLCACGCGKPVRVHARHHAVGIPRYLHGHHKKGPARAVEEIRAAGLFTLKDVARKLGISTRRLCASEGVLFEAPERSGKWKTRVYTPEKVEEIRAALGLPGAPAHE